MVAGAGVLLVLTAQRDVGALGRAPRGATGAAQPARLTGCCMRGLVERGVKGNLLTPLYVSGFVENSVDNRRL